jgi:HAMP domain-containing protein
MDTVVWIAIAAVIVAAAVLMGWFIADQRRRRQLRKQFGPEYATALQEAGSSREAESRLQRRRERVARPQLTYLTAEQQQRFRAMWRDIQGQFVDNPRSAVRRGDHLLADVMRARGYPDQDFETLAADASVDHPEAVASYREAHRIAVKDEQLGATTEELRRAFQSFRRLFDEMTAELAEVDEANMGTPVAPPTSPMGAANRH